jgi:hypothetical protein
VSGMPGNGGPREGISLPGAEELDLSEVMARLKATEAGLSAEDAKARLDEHGFNEISEKRVHPILQFLGFFWGPIPWMIEAAALLAGLIHHWEDFCIILTMLLLNAGVGFWQREKAEHAIALLKDKLALIARVKRDGAWMEIPARELVPGDVVRVRLGDIIPADMKLMAGEFLMIDESALTGESLPVERPAGDLAHAGSIIRRGEMDGLVVATGMETFFGKTARLVAEAKSQSHFQKALIKIGDYLIAVGLGMVAIVFLAALFRHESLAVALQYALVLTVEAVPAILPAVLRSLWPWGRPRWRVAEPLRARWRPGRPGDRHPTGFWRARSARPEGQAAGGGSRQFCTGLRQAEVSLHRTVAGETTHRGDDRRRRKRCSDSQEGGRGIAVAGATDAAKSAADIVLTRPGLGVIVDAIEESRRIFQRMQSYAIYRIGSIIRVLLFVTLSIVVFNFYPVTAVMIVLMTLLNDLPILSIAYDNANYSKQPEKWNMREILSIATYLGMMGVFFSFSLFPGCAENAPCQPRADPDAHLPKSSASPATWTSSWGVPAAFSGRAGRGHAALVWGRHANSGNGHCVVRLAHDAHFMATGATRLGMSMLERLVTDPIKVWVYNVLDHRGIIFRR